MKFDVCWWDDGGGERRIVDVEMPALPRRGDQLDLEALPDEKLADAFDEDEEPHGVDHLVVQRVRFRAAPLVGELLVHDLTTGPRVEVWTSAPGNEVCGHCGRD